MILSDVLNCTIPPLRVESLIQEKIRWLLPPRSQRPSWAQTSFVARELRKAKARRLQEFASPLVEMPPATGPAPAALPTKRAMVRQATKSLEKVAAKGASVTASGAKNLRGIMSQGQKLKLQALQVRPEPSKRAKWILLLLGLDPSRSIWGLKPYDLKWPGRDSEAWFHQVLAAREPPKRPPITRASRRCHRSSTTQEQHTGITTLVKPRPITR